MEIKITFGKDLDRASREAASVDLVNTAKTAAGKGLNLTKDVNYFYTHDHSSIKFVIDETTPKGKEVIEAIYQASSKYTIDPPNKGFKSELDMQREEFEKLEKSFQFYVFYRRDNRPNVIDKSLPDVAVTKRTPSQHMLLDENCPFGDKDSGYISLFEIQKSPYELSVGGTVDGDYIHVLFIPKTVPVTSLNDNTSKAPVKNPNNTALLLETSSVEKLFITNPDGEKVSDKSGKRRINSDEHLFCGRWPTGIEEISFNVSDKTCIDLVKKYNYSPATLYFHLTKLQENNNSLNKMSHLKGNRELFFAAGQTFFLELDVPKDGSCGFHSLGVNRHKLREELNKLLNNDGARTFLAEEIREAIAANDTPQMKNAKLVIEKEEQLKKYDAELNFRMANIKTILIAQLNNLNIKDYSADRLIKYILDNLNETMKFITLEILRELDRLNNIVKEVDNEINNLCGSKEMFIEYIECLSKDAWLGYKSALLYATTQNICLNIWHPDPNIPNLVVPHLTNAAAVPTPHRTINMLHTNRFTHFSVLTNTNKEQDLTHYFSFNASKPLLSSTSYSVASSVPSPSRDSAHPNAAVVAMNTGVTQPKDFNANQKRKREKSIDKITFEIIQTCQEFKKCLVDAGYTVESEVYKDIEDLFNNTLECHKSGEPYSEILAFFDIGHNMVKEAISKKNLSDKSVETPSPSSSMDDSNLPPPSSRSMGH